MAWWVTGPAIVFGCLLALWLLSLATKDVSVIDIFWSIGFLIIAATGYAAGGGYGGRKALLLALVAVWCLRLSGYVLWRNWGKGEDYRYRWWRRKDPARFWWTSLFKVHLFQGLMLCLIAAPLYVALSAPRPDRLTGWDLAGALAWCLGMCFEVVGDWQLARFRRDPANAGQLLRTGLWRYTRHPNYFGEAAIWWGYGIIALAVPGGWWTLPGPALMTYMLVRVTGMNVLERHLARKKPGHEEYVRATSAFVPWFPRGPGPAA